jgi:nicotinamide mononucleotide transporter
MMFFITIFVVFAIYNFLRLSIKEDNYIDIAASGIFFTAMWYMANKKIENWTLWIIGDIIVVPFICIPRIGNVGITIFNFYNFSYFSLFRMEENLKQQHSINSKNSIVWS